MKFHVKFRLWVVSFYCRLKLFDWMSSFHSSLDNRIKYRWSHIWNVHTMQIYIEMNSHKKCTQHVLSNIEWGKQKIAFIFLISSLFRFSVLIICVPRRFLVVFGAQIYTNYYIQNVRHNAKQSPVTPYRNYNRYALTVYEEQRTGKRKKISCMRVLLLSIFHAQTCCAVVSTEVSYYTLSHSHSFSYCPIKTK